MTFRSFAKANPLSMEPFLRRANLGDPFIARRLNLRFCETPWGYDERAPPLSLWAIWEIEKNPKQTVVIGSGEFQNGPTPRRLGFKILRLFFGEKVRFVGKPALKTPH